MKVLMLSLDPNIVHPEKGAGKRMTEYTTLVDKLSIVLFSTGGKTQTHDNLTIYPTSSFKPVSFFKGLWYGYRILRKEKYSLITLQEPFILSFIAFPLAWLFKLPLEVQVHSTFFSPFWKESFKNTLYQWFARIFVPHATCIRAVSERIKKDLMCGLRVDEDKITVLSIFTDARCIADTPPRFDLHTKYPQFDFIMLTASRLVKQKNLDLVVDAAQEIVKRHPHAGLVVVGDGPHRSELQERVVHYKLQDNVVFEGWSNDVVSYYKGADVFLLTSNYEGWAMTVIEAMAAGTAVVMTDVGCAGEVVENGKNGVVAPVGDKQAIVNAVSGLYSNPEERRRLAEAGRKTVLNMRPHTRVEYLALYKKDLEDCVARYSQKHNV